MQKNKQLLNTTDKSIRNALKLRLSDIHENDHVYRVIEELGVDHGACRVDIAVVNGILQGYEIKSDLDTLQRLTSQSQAYNEVFDKMTIVVGQNHVIDALDIVPDWWGVMYAKVKASGEVRITTIRNGDYNPDINKYSLAKLLWRDEALSVLAEVNKSTGLLSKESAVIYRELANHVELDSLRDKVRETLFYRPNWRLDQQLQINGGSSLL
jgi:hypothetical protein